MTEFIWRIASIVTADQVEAARAFSEALGRGPSYAVSLSPDGVTVTHYGASGVARQLEVDFWQAPEAGFSVGGSDPLIPDPALVAAFTFSIEPATVNPVDQFRSVCNQLGLSVFVDE